MDEFESHVVVFPALVFGIEVQIDSWDFVAQLH